MADVLARLPESSTSLDVKSSNSVAATTAAVKQHTTGDGNHDKNNTGLSNSRLGNTDVDMDVRMEEEQEQEQEQPGDNSSVTSSKASSSQHSTQRPISTGLGEFQLAVPQSGAVGDDASSNVSIKRFACPQCTQSFTRMHNLKSHILTHTQERPFTCDLCSSKFRRTNDLKRHMKLHTGDKPYNCKVCGRRFARGDALIRHVKRSVKCTGGDGSSSDISPTATPSYLSWPTPSAAMNSVSISSLTSAKSSSEPISRENPSTPSPPVLSNASKAASQPTRDSHEATSILTYRGVLNPNDSSRPGSVLPPIRNRTQLMSPSGRILPPLVDANSGATSSPGPVQRSNSNSNSNFNPGSNSSSHSTSNGQASSSSSPSFSAANTHKTPVVNSQALPYGNDENLVTVIRSMEARMRVLEERLAYTEARLSNTEEKLIKVLGDKKSA